MLARFGTRFTPTGVGTMVARRLSVPNLAVHPHGRGDNRGRCVGCGACVRFTPTGVGTISYRACSIWCMAVHPHGRGDNSTSDIVHDCAGGSPPRAWGQSSAARATPQRGRFTPTGVGTIFSQQCHNTCSSVHPHGRGDNEGVCYASATVPGSPPRAWGQSTHRPPNRKRLRFTPTGVGTIAAPEIADWNAAVHPHGRGDNVENEYKHNPIDGSPPRAWGQSQQRPLLRPERRFTPTGVGTIYRRRSARFRHTVHPHGRGDNYAPEEVARHLDGSPPRAWGQSQQRPLLRSRRRFTPTGVGTMALSNNPNRRFAGSPPRAWGQSRALTALLPVPRFTPTGVGTMALDGYIAEAVAVHPHGRGDNEVDERPHRVQHGSPPRAWGQSVSRLCLRRRNRFTPTGVGTILASQAF